MGAISKGDRHLQQGWKMGLQRRSPRSITIHQRHRGDQAIFWSEFWSGVAGLESVLGSAT